jgi:cyclopropane-fatty-acyl-phospholipid synthase
MTTAVLPAPLSTPAAEPAQGLGLTLAESGWLPDAIVRQGIRSLLRERRDDLARGGIAEQREREARFINDLRGQPVAIEQAAANAQHYEVPAAFYGLMLGRHRKYSSCWFPTGQETLDQAEALALEETCRRAGVANGQRILEIGCGWGSLSLWMAEHYPTAVITGVSNSRSQRAHILAVAERRGLRNLNIVTADMATFDAGPMGSFDRVVSVECFEHLRNWHELFRRIAGWLTPEGSLFFHVFTHRAVPYLFDTDGDGNWMGRHFFTGGMMPSDGMPLAMGAGGPLRVADHWRWAGTHYAATARGWLRNLDANRSAAQRVLAEAAPGRNPRVLLQRWRMFVMACEELWAFDQGQEWLVSHYRMVRS